MQDRLALPGDFNGGPDTNLTVQMQASSPLILNQGAIAGVLQGAIVVGEISLRSVV